MSQGLGSNGSHLTSLRFTDLSGMQLMKFRHKKYDETSIVMEFFASNSVFRQS